MQKFYLLIFGLLLASPLFSQIEFKPGFYVNNQGDTIKCLIKDTDWEGSPESFKIKMHPDSSATTKYLSEVKLFGIDSSTLFINSIVLIDTSGITNSDLSHQRKPEWKEMQVFLKVLIQGNASLYQYRKGNFIRFFYSIDQGEIEQLVYKEFYDGSFKRVVIKNNLYQQQLINWMSCNSSLDATRVLYNQKSLLKYFREYNSCEGYDFVDFNKKAPRDYFNFNITCGLNYATVDGHNETYGTTFSFDGKPGFKFGFEAEAIMPFNRDKIRIVLLPSYQYFKSSTEYTIIYDNKADVTIDYKAVEIPLGVRYYFFLTDKTKIYLTGLIVPSITFKSSYLEINSFLHEERTKLELNANESFSAEIGFSYQRFNIAFRMNTTTIIAKFSGRWKVGYENLSLKLGYNLFQF